jgi:Protein O-mannosyl-transferase TMEM260-like
MQTQTLTRHDGRRAPATDWLDMVCAAGAGLVALGVYLRTLAPGLVGVLDAPMFQFVGRVLGVAHNPGYPLYVLLTFAFSYLPIGSLAYRINLFSALLGAIAVALTFLLARQLECGRLVALSAALGLAFGQVFWSQAVIAEVYTLHAAIVAGVLLLLIVWARTGRAACYYASVALFAAGLGNHTTLVGFAPGAALFVLLTNPAFALRWRTLVATVVILALGILQYGFVLIRSLDPTAYVESRATTVAELLDVMLGGQFRDRLFAFGWHAVVFDRLPFLFERVIVPEMTLPALALAIIGAVWLLQRRFPAALLLFFGMAAILGFAVNYSVVDTPVFVIPAVMVLWVSAAAGAEQATRLAKKVRAGAVVSTAALLVPAWLLAHNFADNDRSRENTAAVYLDALFGTLPDRSALVHEDFVVDRMVMFKLRGEASSKDHRIDLLKRDGDEVRRALAAGNRVFGFGKSARRLRFEALDFSFTPIPLTGGTLDEFLSHLPQGTAVAIAVPASYAGRLAAPDVSLAAIGGTARADLSVGARQRIGSSAVVAAAPIDLRADATGALIRWGNRDVVRTSEGAAVAVFTPDGKLSDAFVAKAAEDFRVPLPIGPLSIYSLRGAGRGVDFGRDAWSDVTSVCRTGSMMLRIHGGQTAVLYVSDDRPLRPRAVDKSVDRVSFRLSEIAQRFSGHGYLYRLEFHVPGPDIASVVVALGGIPARAAATLTPAPSDAPAATVFTVETAGLLRTPDRRSEVLLMARGEQAQLAGDGWSPVDFDIGGPYRWMTASESMLVVPVAAPDATHVRVQALRRSDREGPTTMALRINETMLPPQQLQSGWHAYEWRMPERLLRQGTNEMAVVVDRPPAEKSIAVCDIRLERRR